MAARRTGAHHHGELESVIYVVRGKARMRWGDHLRFSRASTQREYLLLRRAGASRLGHDCNHGGNRELGVKRTCRFALYMSASGG